MSTLKVDGIRSNSASSDAITLASDGTCTANITNNLSNRNLIINGAMQVAQRGDVSSLQTGYGGCDRFRVEGNTAARVTLNQTTGPTDKGFPYCQEVDVTTATGSLAASAYHYLGYKLEGQDLQLLKKGTANAESVTLSFWVSSPKTGVHGIQLYDADNARHTTKSYTISTANTWEKHTITFSGDTTDAFNNDNGYSLQIYWWLAAGTTYTSGSSATSWGAFTAANAAPGQVNVLDNTNNNFKLTGVQLEVGSVATDFEHRSFATERRLCQRYYQKYQNPKLRGVRGGNNTDAFRMGMTLLVEMRGDPTLSWSGTQNVYDGSATPSITGIDSGYPDPANVEFDATLSGTFTNGSGSAVCAYSGGNEGTLMLSAEL